MDHSILLMERTANLVLSYAIHNQKRSKICSIGMNKRKHERKKMSSLGYLNSFSSFLRAKERHLLIKKKSNCM